MKTITNDQMLDAYNNGSLFSRHFLAQSAVPQVATLNIGCKTNGVFLLSRMSEFWTSNDITFESTVFLLQLKKQGVHWHWHGYHCLQFANVTAHYGIVCMQMRRARVL